MKKKWKPPIREFGDRGARWLFESPEYIRGLVGIINPSISGHCDFSQLLQLPTTLIPADLRKNEADLIFQVPYRDDDRNRDVLIHLLFEHQSNLNPEIGLHFTLCKAALYGKQQTVWRQQKTLQSERRLPLIIPILLYIGEEDSEISLSIKHLIDLPVSLREFEEPFQKALILNVKATSPEELTRTGHPIGWIFRVIQKEHASLGELETAIDEALSHIAGLRRAEREAWRKAVHYLYLLVIHRRRPAESEILQERITARVSLQDKKEATEMAQTHAEALVEKGMEKGMEKGSQDEARKMLLKLMARKFGELPQEARDRINGLQSLSALEGCLEKLFDAESPDQIW